MTYYELIDPADLKPGDEMCENDPSKGFFWVPIPESMWKIWAIKPPLGSTRPFRRLMEKTDAKSTSKRNKAQADRPE